jgi:hypothetical protein
MSVTRDILRNVRHAAPLLTVFCAACGLDVGGTGTPDVPTDGGGPPIDASSSDASTVPDGTPDDATNSGDGAVPEAGPPCPPDGGTSCSGKCVDTKTDPANCGGCGVVCPVTAACEGSCVAVAGALVGFRYDLPCTNGNSPFCTMNNTLPAKTATLTGTTGNAYALTLRVRGVVEQKSYDGTKGANASGTNAQFFVAGGNAKNDQWNVYGLAISDPDASYWLNNGASQHSYVDGMDYTVDVVASGGSTLTLSASSTDNLEAANKDQGGVASSVGSRARAGRRARRLDERSRSGDTPRAADDAREHRHERSRRVIVVVASDHVDPAARFGEIVSAAGRHGSNRRVPRRRIARRREVRRTGTRCAPDVVPAVCVERLGTAGRRCLFGAAPVGERRASRGRARGQSEKGESQDRRPIHVHPMSDRRGFRQRRSRMTRSPNATRRSYSGK